MLFHEIYGTYYRTVEKILTMALEGRLTEQKLKETAAETAYAESVLTIVPALKEGKWQLLLPDLTTPLRCSPVMPVTDLEKRWLKAVLADPRVTLFDLPDLPELADTEPLFTPEDWVVFDRYSDGYPYDDPLYRKRFRIILDAIHQRQPLHVSMVNRFGKQVRWYIMPIRLEYSEKDDKFRLYTEGCPHCGVLNLAKLTYAAPCSVDRLRDTVVNREEPCQVVLALTDERNALERVMLHFAHFKKTARKLTENRYELTVEYDRADETELVIRVLSFGPFLQVMSPDSFTEKIRERLMRQKKYNL